MKNFRKVYIGKGKKNAELDIVRITLPIEDVLKYKYEKEGKEYLTFEVGALLKPDDYGRTHTAWVSVAQQEETPSRVSEPELPLKTPRAKKPRKSKK